jgi:hypothetical protein
MATRRGAASRLASMVVAARGIRREGANRSMAGNTILVRYLVRWSFASGNYAIVTIHT